MRHAQPPSNSANPSKIHNAHPLCIDPEVGTRSVRLSSRFALSRPQMYNFWPTVLRLAVFSLRDLDLSHTRIAVDTRGHIAVHRYCAWLVRRTLVSTGICSQPSLLHIFRSHRVLPGLRFPWCTKYDAHALPIFCQVSHADRVDSERGTLTP